MDPPDSESDSCLARWGEAEHAAEFINFFNFLKTLFFNLFNAFKNSSRTLQLEAVASGAGARPGGCCIRVLFVCNRDS